MRRVLSRLFGTTVTLLLASVLALVALSSLKRPDGPDSGALPWFFNPAPRNARDLARQALTGLQEHPNDPEAARLLSRLGGAALPHVLPNLDRLSPRDRGRVALALVPAAVRMGETSGIELSTPEAAQAFWSRFWQDRAVDFRPELVERVVSRFATEAYAQRREDVVLLDTYAAPALIAALGRVESRQDIARVARLTEALAHVFEGGPVADPRDPLERGRGVARTWTRFWLEQGADYTTLDGPRRVTAMLAQTRYGQWMREMLSAVGLAPAVRAEPFGLAAGPALRSFGLCLGAVLIALFLGVAWARPELDPERAPGLGRAVGAAGALLAATPAAFLAMLLGVHEGWRWGAPAIVALSGASGAAILSRHALATLREARGEQRFRFQLASTLLGLPAALSWIITSVFALELCFGFDGAARAVISSLRRGDIMAGMSLALAAAFLSSALVSLTATGLKGSERTSVPPELVEVGGVERRRRLLAALGTLALMALAGALTPGHGAELAGWRALGSGARWLLGHGVLVLVTAGLVGIALGTLSANGPRLVGGILRRGVELSAALPAALWAAALTAIFGVGLTGCLLLGALRAIDVAWLMHRELERRGRQPPVFDHDLSLTALAQSYNRRLRGALSPALSALALTPAWLAALGTAGLVAEVRSPDNALAWAQLLGERSSLAPSVVAALLLALGTWVLLSTTVSPARRIGRPSRPPDSGAGP